MPDQGASAERVDTPLPVCDECGHKIICLPAQANHRNCCVSIRNHPKVPKGKRCDCCWHKLHRKKHAEFERGKIEFISDADGEVDWKQIRQLLDAARKLGIEYYLAFRLAINGMLTIKDLKTLKFSDMKLFRSSGKKPCVLKVDGTAVELDCDTLLDIESWREGKSGRLFNASYRTFQRKFREAIRLGNVYEYQFHALRATGIMLRAQWVKNLADLEDLRKAARLWGLDELMPYRKAVESKLAELVKFVK